MQFSGEIRFRLDAVARRRFAPRDFVRSRVSGKIEFYGLDETAALFIVYNAYDGIEQALFSVRNDNADMAAPESHQRTDRIDAHMCDEPLDQAAIEIIFA